MNTRMQETWNWFGIQIKRNSPCKSQQHRRSSIDSLFRDESLESAVNVILNANRFVNWKAKIKLTKHIARNNEKVRLIFCSLIDEIKPLTLTSQVSIETKDISSSISKSYTLFSSAGHLCSFGKEIFFVNSNIFEIYCLQLFYRYNYQRQL